MRWRWQAGWAIAALTVLAGCERAPQDPPAPATQASAAAQASSAPPPAAPSTPQPSVARQVKVANDLFSFDYAYPAQAAAIPGLRAWLDGDLDRARRDLEVLARQGAQDARANHYPYLPYASGVDWKVVTDLPGWLSLSATLYDFTGGAHPNHGYRAMLWDKAAGQRMAATELFTSKAALSAAIRAPFCDALDQQRAKRRGQPVNRDSGDDFDSCVDPVDSTVILGSAGHGAFDRIGVLVGPYVAGPYAEGDYEVTLTVTPQVLAAVKPQYRGAFAPGR